MSSSDSMVVALSTLTNLRSELDSLVSLIKTESEQGGLPMRFAELPIMLKQAREQCRVVQRELAAAELPPARSWSNKPKRSSGRSIATQTWSSGYTSPRPSSPRPSALPADASKPSAPSEITTSSTTMMASANDKAARSAGGGLRARSASPSQRAVHAYHRRPLIPVSRWPENEVDPREAISLREQAIKDNPSHPLRVLYVKAPTHDDKELGPGELTAMYARQTATSIKMLGGAERRRNLLKLVFLEWCAETVGSAERRTRRIGKVNKRRTQFFEHLHHPSPADQKGCALHLHRAPSIPNPLAPRSPRPTPQSHHREIFPDLSGGTLDGDITPRGVSPARVKDSIPRLHLQSA